MSLGEDLRSLKTSRIEGQQEEGCSQVWGLEELQCHRGRERRLCTPVETSQGPMIHPDRAFLPLWSPFLFAASVCLPHLKNVFPPHLIHFQAVFHLLTYLGSDAACNQWHGKITSPLSHFNITEIRVLVDEKRKVSVLVSSWSQLLAE